MNLSGYSVKRLVDKLGYRPGDTVCLIHAPEHFVKYLDGSAITPLVKTPAIWVHGFFDSRLELDKFCENFSDFQPEKGIWLSWPKKTSGITTDVTEQTFRDLILPLGWVDTKVCAIDETWSGLLFYRRKN